MTSSRQRRSPKKRDPNSENGGGGGYGSGLTVQDGSQESLVSASAKSSNITATGMLRRKKRRRKIQRTSLATRRRLRFCFLVSVGTFLLVACLYISENHNHTMQRQQYEPPYKDQGAVAEQETSRFERFSAVGTGPMCTALQADDVSYTLVTQFSHDRLWMMEQHCERWGPHPISIAVLTNKTVSSIREELTAMGCLSEQYISVQTLSLQDSSSEQLQDYPVNVLRNMAFYNVQTSHVAYADVDFWESTDLHTNLMRDHVRHALAQDPKAALVLPAFMMRRQCREHRECPERNTPIMPHDQNDLFDLFRHKNATQFDPSNRGGHGSTRYRDWMEQSETELLPISCVLSNRYEPYLVVRYCRDLPPFQTAFSGYGKNKMTWVMQLVRSGYAFWQLGESFLVHYPHLDSSARMQWNGGPQGEQLSKPKPGSDLTDYKRAQTDQTFIEFRDWLYAEIPDKTRIPKCDEAMDDDAKLWVPREPTEADGDDGDDGAGDGTADDEYVTDEETDDAQVEEDEGDDDNGDAKET
jgi:hypothetical protein